MATPPVENCNQQPNKGPKGIKDLVTGSQVSDSPRLDKQTICLKSQLQKLQSHVKILARYNNEFTRNDRTWNHDITFDKAGSSIKVVQQVLVKHYFTLNNSQLTAVSTETLTTALTTVLSTTDTSSDLPTTTMNRVTTVLSTTVSVPDYLTDLISTTGVPSTIYTSGSVPTTTMNQETTVMFTTASPPDYPLSTTSQLTGDVNYYTVYRGVFK